jgi:peptide-methionine (S)-S-oxide reductase
VSDNETLVLGGGCFWCVEAVFKLVQGVVSATPGYAGGTTENPTYREVCRGETGHAEVVRVEFDPGKVALEELLDVFFHSHDPATLNRQGNDVGTQYRSIVLYASEEQEKAARRYMESIAGELDKPIVTTLAPLDRFYPAEEYHRNYFEKNPREPYCRLVVAPKVEKLKTRLGRRYDHSG